MTENKLILPTDLKDCQLTYLHQLAKGMTVYNQGEKAQFLLCFTDLLPAHKGK